MSKYSMDSFCNRKKLAEWKFSRKKKFAVEGRWYCLLASKLIILAEKLTFTYK